MRTFIIIYQIYMRTSIQIYIVHRYAPSRTACINHTHNIYIIHEKHTPNITQKRQGKCVVTYVFSYSKETLHVKMWQFSSDLGMSGWRPPWSSTYIVFVLGGGWFCVGRSSESILCVSERAGGIHKLNVYTHAPSPGRSGCPCRAYASCAPPPPCAGRLAAPAPRWSARRLSPPRSSCQPAVAVVCFGCTVWG